MNRELKATVLLVTYNHKDYIAKSIESVLEQETNFDFVIRVLDDCSTDGTDEILQGYAARYPDKVEYVRREQNLGNVDNTYAGVCSITTPYFALVEGDDWWCDPLKLQSAVDILDAETDCTMLATNTRQIGNETSEFYVEDGASVPRKFRLSPEKGAPIPPYLHTVSRVFRNVFDFTKIDKYVAGVDIGLYFLYLDKGFCYYQDKVTNVYNCQNPASVYCAKGQYQRRFMNYLVFRRMSLYFDGKYDDASMRILEISPQNLFDVFSKSIGHKKTWDELMGLQASVREISKKFLYVGARCGVRESFVNLVAAVLGRAKIYESGSECLKKIFEKYIGEKNTQEFFTALARSVLETKQDFIWVEEGSYGAYHKAMNLLSRALGLGKVLRKTPDFSETVRSETLLFDDAFPLKHSEEVRNFLTHHRNTSVVATGADFQCLGETRSLAECVLDFCYENPKFLSKVLMFDENVHYDAKLAIVANATARDRLASKYPNLTGRIKINH